MRSRISPCLIIAIGFISFLHSQVRAQIDYSQFVFTNVDYNISCIDTNGNASMFAVTFSTSADGSIFAGEGENIRYDMSADSATPAPQEGTPVIASGSFGEVIYTESYTNTYRKVLWNPAARRRVSISLTNVETYDTATFSVNIADTNGGAIGIVKGYVTRSQFDYGTAVYNSWGRLIRRVNTSGPYYTEQGCISFDGKTGVLK